MNYKSEFIAFMARAGVLTFGDFTTKSGRKTPYFINTGNYKTGKQLAQLAHRLPPDPFIRCKRHHAAANLAADNHLFLQQH